MFIAELGKCIVEALELLKALIVTHRILCARHALQAIAGKVALLHGMQSPPRKTTLLVNKEVVHHAAQPGSRLVNLDQVIEFAECFDQQFLKQVFGFGLGAGKSPREAVEAIEVRSHESFKGQVLFGGTHNVPECITTSGPNKGSVDSLRNAAAALYILS